MSDDSDLTSPQNDHNLAMNFEMKPSKKSEYDLAVQGLLISCIDGDFEEFSQMITQYNQINNKNGDQNQYEVLSYKFNNDWTCLHYASFHGSAKILQFLLQHEIDVNQQTIDGWTPLMLACSNNHFDCARLLLNDQRIQIDYQTQQRGTALHLACTMNDLAITMLLLEHNADMSILNTDGKYPIEMAKQGKIQEIMPLYSGDKKFGKQSNASDIPPSLSGYLYWQSEDRGDLKVFLVLDMNLGYFLHYNSRENFINDRVPTYYVPLKKIKKCTKKKIKSGNIVKHCIVLKVKHFLVNYYSYYQDQTDQWLEYLNYGIFYMKYCYQSTVNRSLLERFLYENGRTCSIFEQASFAGQSHGTQVVKFDQFKIINEIGSGSFGKVYQVQRNSTGDIFAMKVQYKIQLLRQKQLKYAVRECKILRKIDHPFIIKLHYAFQTPDFLYLVLDFCPSGDLSLYLDYKKTFKQEVAKFYICEIILAIEHLHSLNIIYRDLKPENILLDKRGHIRLADLGLCKQKIKDDTATDTFCGSPAYLSPEILSQRKYTKQTDLYGIGILLYEMLTGETPYFDENISVLFNQIKERKLNIPKYIKKPCRQLLTSLLSKDPQQRISIKELKQHSFFNDVDWGKMYKKQVKPPKLSEKVIRQLSKRQIVQFVPHKDKDYSETLSLEECIDGFY